MIPILLTLTFFYSQTMSNNRYRNYFIFRKYAISFDSNKDDITVQDRVIQLTIHEVSHQWFGNLVTPIWWDDLWLNEAFAVYFSGKLVDQVFFISTL